MMKKGLFRTASLVLIMIAMVIMDGCSPSRTVSTPRSTEHAAVVPVPSSSSIHHVALLLPLSGSYAPYATAIHNGFFTAYYEQKSQNGFALTISVVNTQNQNIHTAVQNAAAQGADFIVGPLDKTDVQTLANNTQTSVPILALNTSPNNMPINNPHLYEFALSPTTEAQQAAMTAWQDRHHNVIILAPANPLGYRMANAFSAQWKSLGGVVAGEQFYGPMATLSKNIRNVLQIDSAYQNDRALKNALRENVRFVPQRRQDFDSIFLVATPEMGRQIQPLLRFYFAGNIPIYSTSQIYTGLPNASRDQDLDGISFCEMPWVLAPNQMPSNLYALQQRIQTLWPNDYRRLAKFYAMGVDAFNLMAQLNHMQSSPQYTIPGATGVLSLTPQREIYRKLTWATFKNGTPQLH